MGKELDVSFYDEVFKSSKKYRENYAKSQWFNIWVEIKNIIRDYNFKKILDLGCGTGQLAHFIVEELNVDYSGIDFSSEAINVANKLFEENNLKSNFIIEDLYNFDFNTIEYDCIVSTEFLEHINGDVEILKRVRSGSYIIATVPNADSAGHVRFYPGSYEQSQREIQDRYSEIGDFLFFKKINYTGGINHDYLFVIKKR